MHLPVGPARPTGPATPGAPDSTSRATGSGDRARLDQFRLRRGLGDADLPGYAAARLAALDAAERGGPVWRPLGPFAVPHGRTAGSGAGSRPVVAGRVAAMAVDPRDPRHLLAGGGGVWESRDGGGTWACRTDGQPSAAIGALAFAPGDPAVAYAGTGQGEALAGLGVGLLRSADGGTTWRPLVAKELLGTGCNHLLIDPGDPDRLVAATTGGLLRSADGGRSWEPRLPGRSWAVSAGPDGEVLAGGELGLHRSEDGGATWSPVPLEAAPEGFERVAVAHAPGGGVAYVFAAGDGVGHLWRREHPGGPFDPVKPPADLQSRQAWHHWTLAADPAHPDVVWLGAAGLHRGALGPDGRWTWTDLTARPAGDSLPLGQHAVVAGPGAPADLYVAGEGGLFASPDGGRSWRSLGIGLAVAEVDRLADHAAWLLAGAGELGTLRYEGSEVWCPLGPADPAVVAGDELVATGADGLVVSADGGSSWSAVPVPEAHGELTALAAAGPGRLLAGTSEGELLRLERASRAWVVAGVARPREGWVSGVAADPARPGVAWAAWSSPRGVRVWRSGDDGATWTEAGHELPEVPVAGVVPDPDRPGSVYAATDAGVWWSEDDGSGWRPLGRGLPSTPALALALRRDRRLLRVGLLGRGVWELPLDGPTSAAAPALRSTRSPAPLPRTGGPWWECPDLKVQVPPGDGPLTPVEFEDDRWPWSSGPRERGGRVVPGRPARVHVQVHHRGDGPLHHVRIRVLAAPACLRPPDLPTGPWPTGGDDPPPGSPWRSVGPPALVGDLAPGRSAVATFDWEVPTDLPRDLCFVAVTTADDAAEGLWTTQSPPLPAPLGSPSGGPGNAGSGSSAPGAGAGASGVDPADLVTRDGRWGCKNLTVLYPGAAGRVLRLELLGGVGRGPSVLAAEGWVARLTAGLVLPRELGRLAVEGGLEAGRVGEAWRPELVALVREEPDLAGRLDLGTAYAPPEASPGGGLERWLQGMDLDPLRPEPMLLLLRTPPSSGRGCLLLLDADEGLLGGHTFQVAR
jgi:photosystem II stability/assembly factor-like uncharacterized protein